MMNTSARIKRSFLTKSKRRAFTLLELLIVILILSMIGGLFALSIQALLKRQRFSNEANMILDRIKLAQDIMLLFDADLKLIFTEKEEGIDYRIKSEQNIPGNWNQLLLRRSAPLTAIKSIGLDDPLVPSLAQEPLELHFYSKGAFMTRGCLRLSDGSEERYICLSGMPGPLTLSKIPDTSVTDTEAIRRTNDELTQDTSFLINDAIKGNVDATAK